MWREFGGIFETRLVEILLLGLLILRLLTHCLLLWRTAFFFNSSARGEGCFWREENLSSRDDPPSVRRKVNRETCSVCLDTHLTHPPRIKRHVEFITWKTTNNQWTCFQPVPTFPKGFLGDLVGLVRGREKAGLFIEQNKQSVGEKFATLKLHFWWFSLQWDHIWLQWTGSSGEEAVIK